MRNLGYYSIRMHASLHGRHISGAERLVHPEIIEKTVCELFVRARSKALQPDSITITVDLLDTAPLILNALHLTMDRASSIQDCRSNAQRVLISAGVAGEAVEQAFGYLINGAAPSGANMRGAMIVDASTGCRFETDRERGVRASRLDWTEEAGARASTELQQKGLPHFRTYEALAVASKIAHGPAVLAELCWSDDPDYTAGYASSLRTGYVRFRALKEAGNARGGRAIFVDSRVLDLDALVRFLEARPVLLEFNIR